jgi:outer membrane protein OmpA-like peptidoglycan-associated protein
MPNLIQTVSDSLPPDLITKAAGMLGETPTATRQGLAAAAPALLAGALQRGSTSSGANQLLDLVKLATANGNPMDQIGAILSDQNARSAYLSQGQSLANSLLGGNSGNVVSALNASSHVSRGTATNMLAMLAPLVLGILGRASGPNPTATGLQSVLTTERNGIVRALPAGLGSLFGLTSAAPAAAAASAAAKVAPPARSMWRGILPWLVLGALALLLLAGLRTCSTDQAAAPGSQITLRLPDGGSLAVPQGSIGFNVARFLESSEAPPKTFVFDGLTFDTASNAVTAASQPTVRALSSIMKAYPNMQARVVGYTDNQGDPAANLALSQARADAVKQALVTVGVGAERIATAGLGEANPIADNATEAGRARNRRTEFEITRK